jgi:hypothetical protein
LLVFEVVVIEEFLNGVDIVGNVGPMEVNIGEELSDTNFFDLVIIILE